MFRVLERATEDEAFLAQLADDSSNVLKDYELASEEAAALSSGDVRCVEDENTFSRLLRMTAKRQRVYQMLRIWT